ncbi:type II toxin-antitoxin system Phd/YefM family antitoxin [Actimicrobium antarcticum]|uniref:Type II toxin-antitoxin system Phd/YefM family antitoxin n=1 Tax=Actimicrobium antarcticum TaxID=1051899 RepID=A0ABP7T0T5_9BURK
MENKPVSKSEFKSRALEYFRQIESSGKSMIVTDHGRPALEIRPYRNLDQKRTPLEVLRGSVVSYVDPTAPVDVEWESAQ